MTNNKKIFATPKIRKFARELGANISEIEGSERLGRITEEDVKNFVNKNLNKPQMKEAVEMRRFDDQAKILNKKTPSVEHFRKYVENSFQENS